MAAFYSPERFRFLFRQDRGTIDAATWRRSAGLLAGLFALAFASEWLTNRAGKAVGIGVTAIFLVVSMLIAACYYFVSAKRFRDRGRSPLLALALPGILFLDASLHYMQPPQGGYYPLWLAQGGDLVMAGVIVWNIVELGFLDAPGPEPGRE